HGDRFGRLLAERHRVASRPALDRPTPYDVDGAVLVRGAEIDRDALVDVSSRTGIARQSGVQVEQVAEFRRSDGLWIANVLTRLGGGARMCPRRAADVPERGGVPAGVGRAGGGPQHLRLDRDD